MNTEENKSGFPAVGYVVIAVLIWSTGGLFIKLTDLDAFQITFFRSLLAALTVAVLTFRKGLRINAFGLLSSVFYAALLFLFVWATKKTTAANAIFLQYTAPIYVLAFGPLILGEKFRVSDLATVVFCIVGMSLFFVGQLRLDDVQGNIAALGSGVFFGLYMLSLRHRRTLGLNPVITVIYGNLILALLTLPAGISALSVITPADMFFVSFLGIVQIGVAYILFIKGISGGTRPLDASILGFIEPTLNPVWVFLFYGEQPAKWAIVGGAVIIVSVLVHTLRQYKTRTAG